MNKTILEAVVGSTLHGTVVDDGLEDLDLMAVVVEDEETFVGFGSADTWTHRTKPDGVRSEAGDVDYVAYGLKKYLSLALKCNPSVLLPLFAPPDQLKACIPEGHALRALAPSIVSKAAYMPFKGYMKQQMERLIGTRGQKNCTRPELVEKYGYDTKYAGHILRLGFQGTELLSTGRLSLPMAPRERDLVIAVRSGAYQFDTFIHDIAAGATVALDHAFTHSTLPDKPDTEKVQAWMVQTYLNHWRP